MEYQEKMFALFGQYGITQGEICGAMECIKRENNRKPSAHEIIEWLYDYIRWRETESLIKNGEITIEVKITNKYKNKVALMKMVNDIFQHERG